MLFEITKLRIWKQLTTCEGLCYVLVKLFEFTKLRIWKQLTTNFALKIAPTLVVWGHKVTNLKATHNYDSDTLEIVTSCLRSQSYEFESNSQLTVGLARLLPRCLRSQSYEFESNSQRQPTSGVPWYGCLRSQSYEFESNSQLWKGASLH